MCHRCFLSVLVFAATLAGCFDAEDPPTHCEDLDGDGVCAPVDCDDGDSAKAEACDDTCEVDPSATDCACSHEQETTTCYDGDPVQAGVGACALGVRVCNGGRWTACQGQGNPTAEACDGRDDDCDGEVDDGVLSECGDCDETCRRPCLGVGCALPFTPGEGGGLDAEGALVIAGADLTPHILWLDSHLYGVVTKVDTEALSLGPRYRVADPNHYAMMGPLAMDAFGDVYAAMASSTGDTLVKVRASSCEDQDGDGRVETSEGFDDLLAFGRDECVAWTADLAPCVGCSGDGVLALTEGGAMAWVGRRRHLAEVDATTGELTGREIDLFVDDAVSLAADGEGRLWLLTGTALHRYDLADLDEEVVADIGQQVVGRVDFAPGGRVWLTADGHLQSYDPALDELVDTTVPVSDFAIVDDTFAWGLPVNVDDQALLRIDLATYEQESVPTGLWAYGLTLDLDGHVWTGRPGMMEVTAFDVEDGAEVIAFTRDQLCGAGSSDCVMARYLGDPAATRLRRAFGTQAQGATTTHTFDSECEDLAEATLRWQAGPEGRVTLSVRSAATPEGLAASSWLSAGASPPVEGSADLLAALSIEHRPAGRFFEVRAELRGPGATLRQLELQSRCATP